MEESNDDKASDFLALFAKHQRIIGYYLTGLLPTQSDVDDVFQETCLVLWREFPSFRAGSNFGAWACTIAFNQVRAWRSRQRRETLVFSDEFLQMVSDDWIDAASHLETRAKALDLCIQSLPEHHRELIRHRYDDGFSVEAIAQQANRSTDAIYRMLSRVRAALHECVERRLTSMSE